MDIVNIFYRLYPSKQFSLTLVRSTLIYMFKYMHFRNNKLFLIQIFRFKYGKFLCSQFLCLNFLYKFFHTHLHPHSSPSPITFSFIHNNLHTYSSLMYTLISFIHTYLLHPLTYHYKKKW